MHCNGMGIILKLYNLNEKTKYNLLFIPKGLEFEDFKQSFKITRTLHEYVVLCLR